MYWNCFIANRYTIGRAIIETVQDEPLNVDRGDSARVDQFIVDEIDSVPHLEALLLLWRGTPQHFSVAEIAENSSTSHTAREERWRKTCSVCSFSI